MLKEATLEAIGYICQDIESDVLVPQSNEILTAIIHGMKGSSTSHYVRLAATSALYNSLEFTKGNFEIEVGIIIIIGYKYFFNKNIYIYIIYLFLFLMYTDRTKLHYGSGMRGDAIFKHTS